MLSGTEGKGPLKRIAHAGMALRAEVDQSRRVQRSGVQNVGHFLRIGIGALKGGVVRAGSVAPLA